jgi:Protein of unknown function (DUF3606)
MSGDFLWDLVDAARLNLGDDYDVYVLCAALSCYRTDIYTAVSMVGDKIGDIRRYLDRTLGPRAGIELPEAAQVPMTGYRRRGHQVRRRQSHKGPASAVPRVGPAVARLRPNSMRARGSPH